jgi:aminopeptidase N
LLLLAALAAAGSAVAAGDAGEPFFPRAGNRGYDVSSYDAGLAYSPRSGTLRGTTRVAATATQGLRRFSLDLERLRVTGVTVDGRAATFSRDPGKLEVVPATGIAAGARFEVVVRYRGRPGPVVDPDGSSEGWIRTDDGAFAVGEPIGTATWLPCDNDLGDKASFRFRITVPAPLKAVANGRLLDVERSGSRTTFVWSEEKPMDPYLAVIDIGRGRLVRSRISGLPVWTLVDPRQQAAARRPLSRLASVIRFESKLYGPYPFEAAGSIVDFLPGLGYALEAQTRPIYSSVPDLTTIVHETAHQWFGDSVGLKRWPDIWLNEGFATWTEWYYAERHGGPPASQVFRDFYRTPASDTSFWDPPPGRLGTPNHLFGESVYARGAMVLQALRERIGTGTLLRIMRSWATEHRYGTADIDEFVALAEKVSGKPLRSFFQRWLYERGKPGR